MKLEKFEKCETGDCNLGRWVYTNDEGTKKISVICNNESKFEICTLWDNKCYGYYNLLEVGMYILSFEQPKKTITIGEAIKSVYELFNDK